mgnify:CR=1
MARVGRAKLHDPTLDGQLYPVRGRNLGFTLNWPRHEQPGVQMFIALTCLVAVAAIVVCGVLASKKIDELR